MDTQRSAGLLLCWLAHSALGAEHPPASDPSKFAELDLQTLMQMDVIVHMEHVAALRFAGALDLAHG